MIFIIWLCLAPVIHQSLASRAGITHCSGTSYPASISGSSTASASATYYMMQDPDYQFECCGVIDRISFVGSPGAVTLHIWRQNGDTNFELVSFGKAAHILSSSPFVVSDFERVSFREGDLFGWTGGSVKKVASGSKYLNWYSSGVSVVDVGDTHNWYTEAVDSGQEYLIQVRTAQSTVPYFRNLPTTLQYADTEMLISGLTLLNLTYNDLDPDDAGDLTVTLSPAWNDLFELTTGAIPNLIKTKLSLGPGTYRPEFRIEEGHCGVSATATLTVIVTDSVPSINNLPGSATLHEDSLDETLLYTVTMSDPTDQPMWCVGDWTIGTPADGNTPFIVKMLSTAPGNSEAGIYLIEDPQLDYDIDPTYNLTIQCQDTFGHVVTGNFYVSIVENQKPLFYNMGNMVEVDATVDGTGHTAFIVSCTDADNDQITYTYTCNPAPTCPLALYDSGEVMVTDNLLSWTDNTYTLTVTANDHRSSSVVTRDLIVYIANINNAPTLSNVNGNSVTVSENVALGTSLYQMSASDTDNTDTLIYYMVIDDTQGYDILQLSSSGELTTHSAYTINYELLTTHTFTLTVYVNDAKVQYSETFTVTVNDVNEAPEFLAPEYHVFQDEGPAGTFTDNPSILALDVDAGDTLTYTRDCGTYDTYIDINTGDATLSFLQEYDLDDTVLALPTFIQCTIYVHDSGGLNDSTTLYINVEYKDETAPTFSPNSYSIDVNSDTPAGFAVLQVTAIASDVCENSELTYSMVSASTDFVVSSSGMIHASQLLTNAVDTTLTVMVSDGCGGTNTVNVAITMVDVTVNPSVTTDRNWEFIEDPTNVTWLTTSVITIVTCLGIILCMVIVYCMKRETPFIDFKKLCPKKKPRRKFDQRRRPMPYDKQEFPMYRHIHSDEVLRPTSIAVATPAPVDHDSLRPGSATSGRVTITEVRMSEDEPSWMDGYATPEVSAGPIKSVTRPRKEDWEYMNPTGSIGTSVSVFSEDQIYGTGTPGTASPEPRSLSKQRRRTSQRMTSAIHVPVSPSPVPYHNTDDDDFRSERISIATPASRAIRDPSPTF